MALTRPGNLASRRVLEKVGLAYRRTVKFFKLMAEAGTPFAGVSEHEDFDVAQYGIERSEYQRLRDDGLRYYRGADYEDIL